MQAATPSSGSDPLYLAMAAAAILLAPYATIHLPFRTALHAQAVLILAFTLVPLAAALRRRGWWQRLRASPRGLLVPAGLYAGAGLLGTLVALGRGNELPLVVGQLLAVGLLPLAVLAVLALPEGELRQPFMVGLVAASLAAALLHVVRWGIGAFQDRLVPRMYFANSVSMAGISLVALLLAAALASTARRPRWLGFVAVPFLLVYIAGSGIRSLWLLVPAALVLYAVLAAGWRRLLRPAVLATLAMVVAMPVLAVVAVHRWLDGPHPNLLPTSQLPVLLAPEGGGCFEIDDPGAGPSAAPLLRWHARPRHQPRIGSAPLSMKQRGLYRLQACLAEPASGDGTLVVQWLGPGGRIVAASSLVLGDGQGPGCFRTFGVPPEGTSEMRLLARGRSPRGRWRVATVSLSRLGPPVLLPLIVQLRYLEGRLFSIGGFVWHPERTDGNTETIAFRLRESRRLLELFAAAPLAARLLGHGLGARFSFDTYGYDSLGNWIHYSHPNYIHDFYAFLLYKLGLAGTALVLVALALWLGYLLSALRRAADRRERIFLAAAASIWIGELVLNLSSPEIVNFRAAPLLGLLLAVARPEDRGADLPSAEG